MLYHFPPIFSFTLTTGADAHAATGTDTATVANADDDDDRPGADDGVFGDAQVRKDNASCCTLRPRTTPFQWKGETP